MLVPFLVVGTESIIPWGFLRGIGPELHPNEEENQERRLSVVTGQSVMLAAKSPMASLDT